VITPNTLTVGVPKVPRGSSEGFCRYWHLITLGFSRNTRPHTQGIGGETVIEGQISREDTLAKCPEKSGHGDLRQSKTSRSRCCLLFCRRDLSSPNPAGCQKPLWPHSGTSVTASRRNLYARHARV
jgi:hypothetical protein